MNKKLQREILSIAGYGPAVGRDDWELEGNKPEVVEHFRPKHDIPIPDFDMAQVRRLAGLTTQFPQRQVQESVAPMTLLEWGIRTRGRKGLRAEEELNEALDEARCLLDEVFDGMGPTEVAKESYDYIARLIGNVHKRRMSEALVRWGIDAEPRYQIPSALALIDQTRKRFDLPMSSIPALGEHI